jgi:hypothetical protein
MLLKDCVQIGPLLNSAPYRYNQGDNVAPVTKN